MPLQKISISILVVGPAFYHHLCHASVLISPDLGAIDGSALPGTSILGAGDRASLLSAAGLSGGLTPAVTTPDSPFSLFNEVTNVANTLGLLHRSTAAGSSNAAQTESSALPTQYGGQYYQLGQDMSSTGEDLTQCYDSINADAPAISDTWSKGVSTTTQGQLAVKAINADVAQLWHLNSQDKTAVKAGYALFDTWIKTGSPRRRMLQILAGGAAGLPSGITGTYQTLGSTVTDECRSAYKDLTQLYNQWQQLQNQGSGSNSNSGGLPGLGGNNLGNLGGSNPANGGMPGGESFSNPFGTSMSGQDPPGSNGLGGSSSGRTGGGTSMAGSDGGSDNGGGTTPSVADPGTNKCKTFSSGTIGVQLCQGSTTTANSATITGSVINVGQDTLCGLSLIIDQFELASSYYPAWLPTYTGFSMPGDTITFGVTVPYTSGGTRPQADIDSSINVCAPPTTSPTPAASVNFTSPTPTPSAAAQGGTANATSTTPNQPTGRAFDWTNVGGRDTTCLRGCLNIIQDMGPCDSFDAIGAFRCDSCNDDTYSAIQSTCQAQGCGDEMCHIQHMVAHSGAPQSVKVSFSLLLGLISVFFVLLL